MNTQKLAKELPFPFSSEADLVVVGSLMSVGLEPLPRFFQLIMDKPKDYFLDARLVKLAALVAKARSDGKVLDEGCYFTLAQQEKFIQTHEDLVWFNNVANAGKSTLVLAEMYAQQVWEAAKHRERLAILEDITNNITNPAFVQSALIIAGRFCQDVQAELRGTNGIPQIRSIAESLAHPLPLRPPVIHGVLRQSDIMALSGPSKVSKSWTLLAMGLCVGHGLDWLGHRSEPTRVLYCNFELHASDWDHRIEVLCRALNIENPNPENFTSLNCRGYDTTHSTILPQIADLVRRYRYGLIIIDPSYLLYDEDMEENSNADIARLLRYITGIATPGKFAVAFSGHFPKGNAALRAAIDRMAGASTWARYPDCVATVTPLDDDSDEFGLEFQLRGHAPVPRRLLRWNYPLMEVDEAVSPEEVRERLSKKAKTKTETARKTLTKEVYAAQLPRDGTYDVTNPRNGVLSVAQERERLGALGYGKDAIPDARNLAVYAGLAAVTRSSLRGGQVYVGTPIAISLWREKLFETDEVERKQRERGRRNGTLNHV